MGKLQGSDWETEAPLKSINSNKAGISDSRGKKALVLIEEVSLFQFLEKLKKLRKNC